MDSIERKIANQNEVQHRPPVEIGSIEAVQTPAPANANISVEYAFRILAKHWNDIHYDTAAFADKKFQTFDLTPENLNILADELHIETDIKHIKIKKLKTGDFPCLIILEENTCLIMTKILDKRHVEISNGDNAEKIRITELQKLSDGHIILLRPTSEASEQTGNKTASKPKSYNVFSAVLANILSKHKKHLSQMMVAAIISNLMLVALPLFIMSIYDRIIPHLAFETLWVLSIGVMIALSIDFFMKLLRQNLTDAIGLETSVKLQSKLFKHLSRLKFKDVPDNAGGLSHSTAEFDNISQLVPQILVAIFIDLPFFIIILLLLYHLGKAVIIAPLATVVTSSPLVRHSFIVFLLVGTLLFEGSA
ncbi:MAG: hypothetical protein HRU28_19035 [Rhizobiales bacterium]|nr:hypothetical protein [Hyphomicrobiales bacterium]